MIKFSQLHAFQINGYTLLFLKASWFKNGYHLSQATAIKKNVSVPIILVGGLRKRSMMENVLEQGNTDFVSMSRPFIRQPNLVNQVL